MPATTGSGGFPSPPTEVSLSLLLIAILPIVLLAVAAAGVGRAMGIIGPARRRYGTVARAADATEPTHLGYASAAQSSAMSNEPAEWVSAPTLIRSTPLSAIARTL